LEVGAWNFSGACPSSLRFDAVAPKPEAKAEKLALGAFPAAMFAFHPYEFVFICG
jgi:hypothetical protein